MANQVLERKGIQQIKIKTKNSINQTSILICVILYCKKTICFLVIFFPPENYENENEWMRETEINSIGSTNKIKSFQFISFVFLHFVCFACVLSGFVSWRWWLQHKIYFTITLK